MEVENSSASFYDRLYLSDALGLGMAQYVWKLGIGRQCFMKGYILMLC